jgi:hypothetical protein
MPEIVINLHMHTQYSDGCENHEQIAGAAMRAGLDAVIVTDHNVLVNGPERIYQSGERKVVLLVGEEIHDQSRQPQKSHLMVFGIEREYAHLAHDIQLLVNTVRQAGGLVFIAHPNDPEGPAIHEEDISWVDWQIQGYTGIELWNGFSEFKGLLTTKLNTLYYAFHPDRIASGPYLEVLKKWDDLLSAGKRVVAIGGSDAHALRISLGPFKKIIFPYEWHFRGINTHLLIASPLTGQIVEDRRLILEALGRGAAFIGYDLPASTRGFQFTANTHAGNIGIGDEASCKGGVTFQVHLPQPTECRLIHNGSLVKTWQNRDICTYNTTSPGAYRLEAYIDFQGKKRGWIFTNPIYITR